MSAEEREREAQIAAQVEPRGRWHFLLVALAGFLVYAGSLQNDFVYDDLVDIREVDTVFTPGAWPEMFYTASARLFRPFKYLSYHVDNAIWGWKPMGWHLVNLFWHVLTCCLVLAFLRRVGLTRMAALAGGVWFAVHPVHTEAVVWISSRASLLSTAALLGICTAYLNWRERGDNRSLAWLAGWAFFGFFSKEDALMAFPILGAMEWLVLSKGGFDFLKREAFWKPVFVMAPFAIVYVVLRQSILSGLAQGEWENGFRGLVATLPVILARYLGQLLYPVSMTLDQPLDYEAGFGLAFWCSSILVVALVAVMFVRGESARRWKFCVVWFFVTLAPVMGFIPINQPIADRFLYMPSVAAALAVGWGWEWLLKRRFSNRGADNLAAGAPGIARHEPSTDATAEQCSALRGGGGILLSRIAGVAFGSLLIAYAIGSVSYTRVWKDEPTLWAHAVEKNPRSYRGWLNLGVLANNKGDFAEGLRLIDKALEIRSGYVEARVARAYSLGGLGRHAEAEIVYREALAVHPDNTIWMNLLAYTLQQTGKQGEAMAIYEHIFELRPNYVDAREAAGLLAVRFGDLDAAIEHWEIALKLDPARESIRRNLETARAEKGGR